MNNWKTNFTAPGRVVALNFYGVCGKFTWSGLRGFPGCGNFAAVSG